MYPFYTILLFLIYSSCYCQLLSKDSLKNLPTYSSLEEALKEPDKVIKLSLKKQKLTELPEEVLKFKNLQSLSLRNNKLTAFPRELKQLQYLQELDLSRNKMDTIYPEIGELTQLYYLNMNNNELSVLPLK